MGNLGLDGTSSQTPIFLGTGIDIDSIGSTGINANTLTIGFTLSNPSQHFGALIDSGATNNFIDKSFALQMGIKLYSRPPTPLHLIDASGGCLLIKYEAMVCFNFDPPFGPSMDQVLGHQASPYTP